MDHVPEDFAVLCNMALNVMRKDLERLVPQRI